MYLHPDRHSVYSTTLLMAEGKERRKAVGAWVETLQLARVYKQ